jgi:hypothetical protein
MSAVENETMRQPLVDYDRMVVERAGALNRRSQELGLFQDEVDADALVEVVAAFWEGFLLRDRMDHFESSRSRVLRQFYELLIAAVLTDSPTAERLADQLRALAADDRAGVTT